MIDHRFFPHIIDTIWMNMPVASLLTARQVSVEWREAAEKRLFRHITVFDPCGDGTMILVASYSSLSNRSPSRRPSLDMMSGWSEKVLRHTTAMDIDGHPAHSYHTVCQYGDDNLYSQIEDSNKVLDWTRWRVPPGISDYRCHIFDSAKNCVYMMHYSKAYPLPNVHDRNANRAVYSINCHSDPTASREAEQFWSSTIVGAPRSITLILNDKRHCRAPSPRDDKAPNEDVIWGHELGLVYEFVEGVCWNGVPSRSGHILIVGLESFLGEEERGKYVENITHSLTISVQYDPEIENKWWNTARFCTHDEYKDMVGEETYRMHTVW